MDSSDLHSSLYSSGESLAVGSRLGPYVIRRRIALGGMGAVYEAFHEGLGRSVALKTMLDQRSSEDVQRFINEARIVAQLNHPHVVPVYDAGEAVGLRYLVMEMIQGESVHSVIEREGPLAVRDALEIVRDVARGVQQAHQLGVLHRDLKPGNVLIDEDGAARLTDFGAARAPGDQRLTATGTVLGTPSYMAPEQARGDDLDARSDVYGLGAILYECLTGERPFEEDSFLNTMRAVVERPVDPPRHHRPGIPRDAEAICLKALEKNAEDRYLSAAALAEDIDRFLRGEPTLARPLGPAGLALRTLRRNLLLVATTTVFTLVVCALVLIAILPMLRSKGLDQVEQQASAWKVDRLEAIRAELAKTPADARLTALLEVLGWEQLQREAMAALRGEDDPRRAVAIARGLGGRDAYRKEVAPLLAEIKLRLGSGDGTPDGDALVRLAEAAIHDPQGSAGRRARLTLAKLLYARQNPLARSLAVREVEELAGADDPLGQEARLTLAKARADELDWSGAASLLAAPGVGSLPAAAQGEARLLRALATSLAPSLTLPEHDRVTLMRTPQGPGLALLKERELSLFPLRRSASGGLTAPTRRWELSHRPSYVGSVRWTDSEDLIVMKRDKRRYGIARIPRSAPSGQPPYLSPVEFTASSRIVAVAQGDLNGDRRTDLVLITWEFGNESRVVLGGRRPQLLQLLPRQKLRQFAFKSAVLADLDGDGRDEVVLGPSIFDPYLQVLRFDPARKAFTTLGRLPLAQVDRLRVVPTGTRREEVLAVVDYQHDRLTQAPNTRPWQGRDGIYLVGLRGARPAFTGRWTFGPETRPDPSAQLKTTNVDGWALRLDGEIWIARTHRDLEGLWRWDLAPRSSLTVPANAKAALSVICPTPPANPHLVAQRALGSDDRPTRILGGRVLGLGTGAVAAYAAQTPPARSMPQRLMRAARVLQALGLREPADRFLLELRTSFPDSWAVRATALGQVDALLVQAREERRRSRRAFGLRDAARGRARDEAARALFRRAARLARDLASGQGAGVPNPGRSWTKAAYAFEEAGDLEAAARAIRKALRQVDLGVDTRARLAAKARVLAARRAAGRLSLDFARRDVRRVMSTRRALGTRPARDGVSVRVSGDMEDGALVSVRLKDPQPLVVEASLEMHGHAWLSRFQVGLFERGSQGALLRPTGFSFGLWSMHSGKTSCTPTVGGVEIRALQLNLPTFDADLNLRLAVTPLPGGGSQLVFELLDEAGQLLHRAEHETRVSPAPARGRGHVDCFLGLRAPRETSSSRSIEQRDWGMQTWVTLRRVTVHARQPTLLPGTVFPLATAHTRFALGETDQALAMYEQIINAPQRDRLERLEALWCQGLARGRLGEPAEGAQDLLQVARQNPLRAIRWFEDACDVARDSPADLTTIGRALHELAAEKDPLLRAMGRSLLGDLSSPVDPRWGTNRARRLATGYLDMRRAAARDRWRTMRAFQQLAGAWRLPRKAFPQILAVPAHRVGDAAWQALLRRPLSNPYDAYRCFHQALAARPAQPEPYARLATLFHTYKLPGLAVGMWLEAASRARGRQRTQILVSLALLQGRMRRFAQALQTVERCLRAGGTKQDLRSLEPVLGRDPRFRKLMRR